MSEEKFSLDQLVNQDPRYPIEAYIFVREALAFAADSLELDDKAPVDQVPGAETARHLTGQELCEAVRQFAINQYGYMAKVVLERWGITATSNFGDIVYNMIDMGIMKKSPQDRRSHFDKVYEFSDVFESNFEMCNSKLTGH